MCTTETLQDEVELSSSLEGVKQVHNERVSDRLQNLSLRSCMSCILGVTHYFGLHVQPKEKREERKEKEVFFVCFVYFGNKLVIS